MFTCAVFPAAVETLANCVTAAPFAAEASITFVTRITSATPRDCVPVTGGTIWCPAVNLAFCCVAVPSLFNEMVFVLISFDVDNAVAFTLVFVFGVFPVWSQVAYTLPLKDPAVKVKLSRFGVIVTWLSATTVTLQSTISPATIWGSSVPLLVATATELFDATKI